MKVAVLGSTLYAGVVATLMAEYGNRVVWFAKQKNNSVPYYQDSELNHRLEVACAISNLKLESFENVSDDIDVYFFCYHPSEFLTAVADLERLPQKKDGQPRLMINGSTFGLKGTARLKDFLLGYSKNVDESKDHWVYIPDVIQEGTAVNSFLYADEVIIGISSPDAKVMIKELLRPFYPRENQYLFMPILDAEFAKLSVSGMLATRISYMNDLARVAETLGVDIINVKQGLGADSRIGASYLSPGVGFGGENFSHDILTLTEEVTKSGAKSHLLSQVWAINESQKELLFRKLWCHFETHLAGKVIGIWGASFKENTPSIHNSPIHNMLQALWAQGAIVQLHDPEALGEIARVYGEREDLILCDSRYAATKNADALCVLTAWREYFSPDYARLKTEMKEALILDGRNIYDPEYVKAQGFSYEGVGRA